MKKWMAWLMVFCLVMVFLPLSSAVKDYSSGPWQYILLEDGTVEITVYWGVDRDLVIPGEFEGKKVTSIAEYAICNNYELESVTFPDSVTTLKTGAFLFCTSLAGITIPDTITNIPGNPFLWCNALTQISVSPDHPTLEVIDGVLFSKPDRRLICYSTALPEGPYEIPEGTQAIGSEAFRNCENLTGLTIPDSVWTIGEGAFSNCVSLKELVIPFGVTTIGLFAFSGCGSLVRLTIPGSVTNIDDRALYPEDFRTVIVTKGSYAQWFCDSHGIACEFAEGNP